jgi:hypothetical protein
MFNVDSFNLHGRFLSHQQRLLLSGKSQKLDLHSQPGEGPALWREMALQSLHGDVLVLVFLQSKQVIGEPLYLQGNPNNCALLV